MEPRHPSAFPPLPVAGGALALAIALVGGAVLWAGFGEAVHLERLVAAIANCF